MAYTKTNAQIFSGLITGVSVGGAQVGWTGNRVAIAVATETEDYTGGQSHTAIATAIKKVTYTVTFSLREFSLANLAIALGQAASAVTNTGSSITVTGTLAGNVAIKFEAYNEQNSKYHTFWLPVCKFSGSGEIAYDSEAQGDMSVTFTIIDSSGVFLGVESNATSW